MIKEVRIIPPPNTKPVKGTAGLRTQLPGMATTVSSISQSTGGIGGGKLTETHNTNKPLH